MAKGNMNFYNGINYGFDPIKAAEFDVGFSSEYPIKASQIGLATDPRLANQISTVNKKLNTGARVFEVQGTFKDKLDTIPIQHFDEMRRLAKLSGSDLTFHGPLFDPAAVERNQWGGEEVRQQNERHMWQAVEKAHKLDPKGNIVVTFHSSNGLPPTEERLMTEIKDPKTGEKKKLEQISRMMAINEEGGIAPLPADMVQDYFKGVDISKIGAKDQLKAYKERLDKVNHDVWLERIRQLDALGETSSRLLDEAMVPVGADKKQEKELQEFYKSYFKGVERKEILDRLGPLKNEVAGKLNTISRARDYLESSYNNLNTLYNQAYEDAMKRGSKQDMKRLDSFRDEMKRKVGLIEDPTKLPEFAGEIEKGLNVLRSITPPKTWKPLREFAIDKASDTFSGLAFNSYKKFGRSAPIISVENPPAGGGLDRAEDLKDLIEESRKKLQERLIREGASKSEAKEQASKLLGVTWDVGHINMIRKYGFGNKDVVEETKKVAPYVKHVHLSDNFGMEHTELPMGMGNVPLKPMIEAIKKYNDKVKQIVETGNWYGPEAFGNMTPFRETLRAMGSPIYGMNMAPYWNSSGGFGGYFSGYGEILPDQHFSQLYGGGFANLPPELGGELSGRSRLGGTPTES